MLQAIVDHRSRSELSTDHQDCRFPTGHGYNECVLNRLEEVSKRPWVGNSH
jgi:hypothetical protein